MRELELSSRGLENKRDILDYIYMYRDILYIHRETRERKRERGRGVLRVCVCAGGDAAPARPSLTDDVFHSTAVNRSLSNQADLSRHLVRAEDDHLCPLLRLGDGAQSRKHMF